MLGLIVCCVAVVILLTIIGVFRDMFFSNDVYEEEVVTTTTVEQAVHSLVVLFSEDGTQYVIDPADGEKIQVHPLDDMYEDADGGIWELIREG